MSYLQRKPYENHITATIASKIAQRLWSAWNRFLFMDGEEVHLAKYGEFNSVESNSPKASILLKTNYKSKNGSWKGEKTVIVWSGLELPMKINQKKPYEIEALQHEIAYNRIVRKFVRGKISIMFKLSLKELHPLNIMIQGKENTRLAMELSEYMLIQKRYLPFTKIRFLSMILPTVYSQ